MFHDLHKIMVKLKCLSYLHNFKIFHCFKSFAVGKKAVAKSKNDKTNLLRHVTITINKASSKLTNTTIEQLLPKTPVQNQQ